EAASAPLLRQLTNVQRGALRRAGTDCPRGRVDWQVCAKVCAEVRRSRGTAHAVLWSPLCSPKSPTKGFPPMLRTTSKRSRTQGSEASSRKLGGEVREPAEAEEASVQLELTQAEEENRWLHGERDRMRRESNLLAVSIGVNMEAE
ncbi:unnamed protein product, partial [Prorocentrum cordatum]